MDVDYKHLATIRSACLEMAVRVTAGYTNDPKLVVDAAQQFEDYLTRKAGE